MKGNRVQMPRAPRAEHTDYFAFGGDDALEHGMKESVFDPGKPRLVARPAEDHLYARPLQFSFLEPKGLRIHKDDSAASGHFRLREPPAVLFGVEKNEKLFASRLLGKLQSVSNDDCTQVLLRRTHRKSISEDLFLKAERAFRKGKG
jgi:hypothetical protein